MSHLSHPAPAPKWPIILLGIGALLLVGALILGLQPNRAGPAGAATTHPVEETYPEVPRVSLAKAKAAFDAGTAVFVDVRDADSFAAGHIPGAVSLPLVDLEGRLAELNRSDWIITYCT